MSGETTLQPLLCGISYKISHDVHVIWVSEDVYCMSVLPCIYHPELYWFHIDFLYLEKESFEYVNLTIKKNNWPLLIAKLLILYLKAANDNIHHCSTVRFGNFICWPIIV